MNVDIATKYGELLERLYNKTKAKTIIWELDGQRHPKAELGGYIIRLYDGRSGGNPIEYMALCTQFDEPIETINDEDLLDIIPSVGSFDSYYFLMDDLRSQAFRFAVGADKALDDLLGKLSDDEF